MFDFRVDLIYILDSWVYFFLGFVFMVVLVDFGGSDAGSAIDGTLHIVIIDD